VPFKNFGESSDEEQRRRKGSLWAKAELVGLQQWVDCFTEALLKHCGINFIDRVCQRNRAIGGRVSAILVATFENHNNFCELPMIWGYSAKKAVIVMS
jgi:hypothetical protein